MKMKTRAALSAAALMVCAGMASFANATVIYDEGMDPWSYIGDPWHGTSKVSSAQWVAHNFVTPATVSGDYSFSAAFGFEATTGNTNSFTVKLYGQAAPATPGSAIATLSGDSDPDEGGVITYTLDSVTLSPSTDYWLVLSSGSATGEYLPYFEAGLANPVVGTRTAGVQISTDSGASWVQAPHWRIANLDVIVSVASPVPEPASLAIIGLGAMALRRRRRD